MKRHRLRCTWRRRIFARTIPVIAAVLLFSCGGFVCAETQTFDTEAAASAAGWTEFGSRVNNFDFGFSATNNAEGASGAGEGGGVVARSQPSGYYGDITLGGQSDLSIDLHATGRLKFQDVAFDGEFFFGWFDRVRAESNAQDYLGIRVREPRNALWRVVSSIDGADGNQLDIPSSAAYDFAIDWDADGGAAAGTGKLTVSLSTLDGAETLVSTIEGSDSMNFDAFGLMTNPQSGRPDQIGNFWFDDLNYSVVPEPTGVVLALGAVMILFCGRGRSVSARTLCSPPALCRWEP